MNLIRTVNKQTSPLLKKLAGAIDITDAQYDVAEKRYKSVSEWLGEYPSDLEKYNPDIYTQGSFRIGTMVRPISGVDQFDIDLVCELQFTKEYITQDDLKRLVGNRLIQNETYKKMLISKKRCWQLEYAESTRFHMDILPAIPAHDRRILLESAGLKYGENAILVPDKELKDWVHSNPKGFAEWFKSRMERAFMEKRAMLAEAARVDIEEVPEYSVKTPLQRVVQLFKRHRDMMFGDDPRELKPISCILTTLAGKHYQNEGNLLEAMESIITGIKEDAELKDGIVKNPVDIYENFADKWKTEPQKGEAFFQWLERIQSDLRIASFKGDLDDMTEALRPVFGAISVNEAVTKLQKSTQKTISTSMMTGTGLSISTSKTNLPVVSHQAQPVWTPSISGNVSISGMIKTNGSWQHFKSNSAPLPKGCSLTFTASTSIDPSYNVHWQIVNTGEEAKRSNGLRGIIFLSKSAGVGGLRQKEATAYKGKHWVECFIVKNGYLVARSGEFIVNIA
jgi:Adenylyl/Guanylyl and SMODS C-terminal sensor domain/Second Messenger Oligonucleotide or Dinucleotide Synthetase domain